MLKTYSHTHTRHHPSNLNTLFFSHIPSLLSSEFMYDNHMVDNKEVSENHDLKIDGRGLKETGSLKSVEVSDETSGNLF